jgi:RNA polymerase sigma factor (sigma-70 family)
MWCTVENGGVVMSDRSANVLGHLIRGIAAEAAGEPDGALVARFLAARDERAFESLVFRYGSMVYRVCLRNAGSEAAAEDAYQATFLVLARDLSAVRDRQSLASWLHGVARRVALKARAGAEARRVRERSASRAEAVPPSDPARAEALTALDEELARLPDRYRLPLVLCYLDGRTRDEAARLLGWSLGTLKRRLAEGRDALSARLVRRGVGPAALSAVLLSECVAGAASTPRLLASIVSTASPQAAPLAAGVPGHILSLANGVSNMFLTKTKLAIAALVLTAAVGLPAGLLLSAAQPPRTEPPPPRAEKAAVAPAGDAKTLQGKWTTTACEMNGEVFAGKRLKDYQFDPEFSGDTFAIQFGEIKMEGTFELDPAKSPKTITLKLKGNPGDKVKDMVTESKGIYSLDGDKLRICIAETSKPRPVAFQTKAGSGHTLMEFKRIPPPEKNGKDRPVRTDAARDVVDQFLTAALAGDTKKARALASTAISDQQIARFKGLAKSIPVVSAYATTLPILTQRGDDAVNDGLALIVTDGIEITDSPRTQKGQLVFSLLKDDSSQSAKGWLICDIDLRDATGVERLVKSVFERDPKAQGGPVNKAK